MHITPAFQPEIAHLDLVTLTASSDVTYFLDLEFRLAGFNPAWEKFAQANGGAAMLADYPLGSPVLNAFSGGTREYYQDAYQKALRAGTRFDQDYECSSPDQRRIFHQSAYPLPSRRGWMITNHLVAAEPFAEPGRTFGPEYLGEENLIVQCSHCRKVKNHREPERWDWVPGLVAHPDPNTSFTFCAYCLDHYYPDLP